MSKHHQKLTRSLTGQFLGWGDDRTPHRSIKLATASGLQTVKVAKSLRAQIQNWQPGISLHLLTKQRVNLTTGETSIKVKQLLTLPSIDFDLHSSEVAAENAFPVIDTPIELPDLTEIVAPIAEILVCQGSSCRRRGSEGICRSMQAYLAQHDLTDRVEIKPVKCLHQCKAAPHAIFTGSTAAGVPDRTHYRQLQHYQLTAILAKHFPLGLVATPGGTNLIEQISNYLQKCINVTTSKSQNFDSQSCKT
jgi:hypothetical protein